MGGSNHSSSFGQHGLVVIELYPSPTESAQVKNSSEVNSISALPSELLERINYLFLPSQPPLSHPTPRPSALSRTQHIGFLSPAVASFLLTVFILCVGLVFILSICYYEILPCDANENGGTPVTAIFSRLPLSVSLPMAVATLVSIHNNPAHDTTPRGSGGDDSVYARVAATGQNSVLGDSMGLVV